MIYLRQPITGSLLLTSQLFSGRVTKILGFSCRQTFFKYPNNAKPCSLPAINIDVGSGPTNGNGAFLTTGGVWTNASDINRKEDFTEIDGAEILEKIIALPVTKWRYKGTEEYHIGPMAQDFKAAFNVGVDNRTISTIDPSGVALAAIQELIKENEQLKKRIEALENKQISQ